MAEATSRLSPLHAHVSTVAGEAAAQWDAAGRIPLDVLRSLGSIGLFAAQISQQYGGQSASSRDNGELTAQTGTLCSSLRSIMTSQGMAAHVIERFGTSTQRADYLSRLVAGQLAAVGFTEASAGSDLGAMATTIDLCGDTVTLNGAKRWVTAATYADHLLIFGQSGAGAGVVAVPSNTAGLSIEPVVAPLGCRAAGHAHVELRSVRLSRQHLLGESAFPMPLLITAALLYGRLSVAWGCVGILRACLQAASAHVQGRAQFGATLDQHQLVAEHIAELYVSEKTAALTCEYASRCWDENSPDVVVAAVLAKYHSARSAARGASRAVQLLASAGATDDSVVARAYRDAKLMEIIEGTNEICKVMLAQNTLASHAATDGTNFLK